jgi:Ca2+-binding EF-hand superfamily protein
MSSTRRNKWISHKSKVNKSSNLFSIFDQNQIQEFKEAFNLIDQDKDGIISANDLNLMLNTLGFILF